MLRRNLGKWAMALGALAAGLGQARAGVVLEPKESPDWKVSEWINGDPGRLASHKGRVVVIHFFQMWCPGCNHSSIPAVKRWDELWGERDDYMTVSIHSVFEGHPFQTPDRLRAYVREQGLRHPVGIDAYADEKHEVPETLQRFRANGTPHIAIVDKEGRLVFSHFGTLDLPMVELFIERLLKEDSTDRPPAKPTRHDATLSGAYELTFTQTSKSCGELRPPVSMPMRLEVYGDRIDADFPSRFMGLNGLSLRFVPAKLAFEGLLEHRATVRGEEVTAQARIRGSYVMSSSPPALTYEVTFSKRSENSSWDCDVQAKGTAVRTGD
jgi:hypothetical protein